MGGSQSVGWHVRQGAVEMNCIQRAPPGVAELHFWRGSVPRDLRLLGVAVGGRYIFSVKHGTAMQSSVSANFVKRCRAITP